MNDIIQLPERLKKIMDKDQKLTVKLLSIIDPFTDILRANDLFFFPEYTDHGIKHIENTLRYAENLIAEDTFSKLTAEEVGVMLLSIVLHDIGMHTNAEMFKNMIDGKYDGLVNLFPDGKTWKELWEAFLYDSQYWGEEKKNTVFGDPTHNISIPILSNLQNLTEYDRKLIGEFVRIHHCRIAHEVAINGYMGRETIPFVRDDIKPLYFKIAGIVARSHGMNVRDTFGYLKGLFGRINNTSGIHAVYLMVLLRLADYLQIDNSRTSASLLKINTLYSHYSRQEHKMHLSIENVEFTNTDKEKIDIQACPEDAQTYVKIEKLTEDIQKELDQSWAILGEVYPDYNHKLRYRRITTNISDEDYKKELPYVPEQFGFRYNNDLFKLLIAPLYGDDPSYGVRELVQNAVDACRLCMDEIPSDGEPHVKVEVDSQKSLFTITDRGKGMNLYEIKNYFLTIGSSYNDNIDWKKTRDQEHIYRTGRFGIGILAAFLLGSEIKVVTRKRDEKMGYGFTASLHDKFIQIEKVPNAEYGTKIEIKCSEKYMKSYNSKWYNWYIGKIPQVVYYYDGKPQESDFDLRGYKKLNHSSEKFGNVYWKPKKLFGYDSISLYCNGFHVCNSPNKHSFLLNGFDEFSQIGIPSLQITDIFNQLPLNLQRNNVDANVIYEFEPELAREVFIDTMSQLMATDVDSLFHSHKFVMLNYHSDGFSIKSNYINNYVKEKGVIRFYWDYSGRNKTFYELNDVFRIIMDSKCFIRFDVERALNSKLSQAINKYETGGQGGTQKQIELLSDSFDGCFAVVDDYSRQIRSLKHHFSSVLHSFNGRLIFAPSNPKMEKLLKEIISHLEDYSIRDILIEEIKKKLPVPKTCIDDLFEKYMGKDPVVPYEMEERKRKFPLLFQDYSEVIEHYIQENNRER